MKTLNKIIYGMGIILFLQCSLPREFDELSMQKYIVGLAINNEQVQSFSYPWKSRGFGFIDCTKYENFKNKTLKICGQITKDNCIIFIHYSYDYKKLLDCSQNFYNDTNKQVMNILSRYSKGESL